VKFPLPWELALAKANAPGAAYLVAMEIIRRNRWNKEFSLPNEKLSARGVTREAKRRALLVLERSGFITVDRRKRRSPRIAVTVQRQIVS
jgi:hypothetical protein